jgi:UDP-N-acetylmuramoylalanine--D-glutamate ligase
MPMLPSPRWATPGVAVVYGIAITGSAVADALRARGYSVRLADDSPNDDKRRAAALHGSPLVETPAAADMVELLRDARMLCPAPGVPETHPIIRAARDAEIPIVSELDLAYVWEQHRPGGPRPMLAITGTDGKTTTTEMATAMLRAAGLHAVAVGNTETPLVRSLDDAADGRQVDVFVVEASSFRLHWTTEFRCEASVWLNLAPDHQNWHTDMASYESAKERIWRYLRPSDTAVGCTTDRVVMAALDRVGARRVTFAGRPELPTGADYRVEGSWLVGPHGPIVAVSEMSRRLPHDQTNALAAAALVLEAGLATTDDVARALRDFVHPPHRIEPLGTLRGVDWFNDSKATSPHAAMSAIRSFEHIVLLAGGRNKGLDLTELASEHRRIKHVVALGEAADEVRATFAETTPVTTATSMADAVQLAANIATSGDTVLLSPACASFDWYPGGGYPARGDDFKQLFNVIRTGARSS